LIIEYCKLNNLKINSRRTRFPSLYLPCYQPCSPAWFIVFLLRNKNWPLRRVHTETTKVKQNKNSVFFDKIKTFLKQFYFFQQIVRVLKNKVVSRAVSVNIKRFWFCCCFCEHCRTCVDVFSKQPTGNIFIGISWAIPIWLFINIYLI